VVFSNYVRDLEESLKPNGKYFFAIARPIKARISGDSSDS
jgi:hypothetical protein